MTTTTEKRPTKKALPTQLFKVLSATGRSCHGGNLQWPLPTQRPDGTWAPGEPVRVEGKIVPCRNGIHLATTRQVVESWMGERVYVAQWRGELVDADDKWVAREVRLLHPTAWDDRIARHFAADCAERALQCVTRTDVRSWAAIHAAQRFADGEIDRDALRVAARAAYAAYAAYAATAYGVAYAASAAYAAYAAYVATVGRVDVAYAAYAAYTATARAAHNAERKWQAERFLYYLQGGQPPCSA